MRNTITGASAAPSCSSHESSRSCVWFAGHGKSRTCAADRVRQAAKTGRTRPRDRRNAERGHQLQDIPATMTEETNRHLHVLSVLTTLLPAASARSRHLRDEYES